MLVALFITSLFGIPELVPKVDAIQGEASVYILQLDGVGSWGVNDKSKVTQGAIEASTPTGKYTHIPRAHPVFGKTPPFFETSYAVIRSWDDYWFTVCKGEPGKIMINTHGGILPVPFAVSSKEDWVNIIAGNLISRRWTWVNARGCPFYYVWLRSTSTRAESGSMWQASFQGSTGQLTSWIFQIICQTLTVT